MNGQVRVKEDKREYKNEGEVLIAEEESEEYKKLELTRVFTYTAKQKVNL